MSEHAVMASAEFAGLGEGRLAYVKAMKSEELKATFPNVPQIEPGLDLWALLGADGSPIMVADSREALVQNAWENDLETVSVH